MELSSKHGRPLSALQAALHELSIPSAALPLRMQAPAVCRIKKPGGGDYQVGWFEAKPGGGTCYMGDVRKMWSIQTPIGFNSLDWAKNGTAYGMQVRLPAKCRATTGVSGCRRGGRGRQGPSLALGHSHD